MKRYEAIKRIKDLVKEEVIVSNIGDPSKELYAAGDRMENFYMLGSMGLASSIGLGISLANKKKVIVLDGDGSVLMNLGSLATIAAFAPNNYILIVLDNGAYGSTGYQETIVSKVCDLRKIALSTGNRKVYEVTSPGELDDIMRKALTLDERVIIIVKVTREHKQFPIIPIKADKIKNRFMRALSKSKKDML